MEDFIYEKSNVLSIQECKEVIDYFEYMKRQNLVFDRQQLKDGLPHHKKDEATFITEPETIIFDKTAPITQKIVEAVKQGYHDYIKEFSVLAEASPHGIYSIKIQKTQPGGGFHKWHYENDGRLASHRFMVFMIYLNTVTEGGETEFLYQRKRFNATQGKLLLWPAAYTHAHRGNTPLNGDKYIATGWIEFFE